MGHLSKFLAAALVVGAQAETATETAVVTSVFTSKVTGNIAMAGSKIEGSATTGFTDCSTAEVAEDVSAGISASPASNTPTDWLAKCATEAGLLEKAVCNFLSTASGQSGLFTCDSTTATKVFSPDSVGATDDMKEQVAMVATFTDEGSDTGNGTYNVAYEFTLKDTSAAAAGDKATALAAAITAAGTAAASDGTDPAAMTTLITALTPSSEQTAGAAAASTGDANAWLLTATAVAATDASIDHIKEVETTTTGTNAVESMASTTVYNWQAYSSTLAGSVDLKSDISGITGCDDATKMMGDTAACVTLRGEIGTGICNGFASLLNTAASNSVYTTEVHTANNKYWRCTGDRSHFAITGIADKAARRLEEDKFLGDKRRLAAATHTYSYGVTKWHSASGSGETAKTAKENAEAESKIDMDYLNAALEAASKEATLDVVGNAIFAVSYTAVDSATWACDGASGDAANAQTCVADMSAVTATQAARPSEKSAMRTMSLGAMTAVILFFASLY